MSNSKPTNFSEWWAKFNRTATDADDTNLSIYVLSKPFEARREAAEAAWNEAWRIAHKVSKAEPIKASGNFVAERLMGLKR